MTLLIVLILTASSMVCFGANQTVKATLPPFRVQLNGTEINSKTAEYPLLVYKDIQ